MHWHVLSTCTWSENDNPTAIEFPRFRNAKLSRLLLTAHWISLVIMHPSFRSLSEINFKPDRIVPSTFVSLVIMNGQVDKD
jgi:hypothetical protein